MRATLIMTLCFILFTAFLWATLSGAWLVIGLLLDLVTLVITIGYQDTMLLVLLGAREVTSNEEKDFFEAASQEAYKLSLRIPRLYFYNGSLERAFVLQNGKDVSLVVDKNLLLGSSKTELSAICFELLLQVKKGMAPKRTKSMFVIGFLSWITHSVSGILLKILPFADVRRAINWTLSFLIQPILEVLFRMMVTENYFRRLDSLLSSFPLEKDLILKVGLKVRTTNIHHSLPSRKLLELSSIYKSRQFQSMMVLEFLPHEWDYLFVTSGLNSVE